MKLDRAGSVLNYSWVILRGHFWGGTAQIILAVALSATALIGLYSEVFPGLAQLQSQNAHLHALRRALNNPISAPSPPGREATFPLSVNAIADLKRLFLSCRNENLDWTRNSYRWEQDSQLLQLKLNIGAAASYEAIKECLAAVVVNFPNFALDTLVVRADTNSELLSLEISAVLFYSSRASHGKE